MDRRIKEINWKGNFYIFDQFQEFIEAYRKEKCLHDPRLRTTFPIGAFLFTLNPDDPNIKNTWYKYDGLKIIYFQNTVVYFMILDTKDLKVTFISWDCLLTKEFRTINLQGLGLNRTTFKLANILSHPIFVDKLISFAILTLKTNIYRFQELFTHNKRILQHIRERGTQEDKIRLEKITKALKMLVRNND